MILKRAPSFGRSKEGKQTFWSPAVTILAVLLLISYRSLPHNCSVTSVAEIMIEVAKLIKSASRAKSIPAVVSVPFDDIMWDEPKSSKELFKNDGSKIMWAYWDKGLEGMPPLCQHAITSWQVHNPNWRVIILDDNNYQEYVSVSDLPTTYFSLKVQHRSDLLRLAVLLRYGGTYMDASTLVFKSFDDIWDTVEEDKLMLTSLNMLPESKLDLFNNGLLMTKGTNNKALRLWQQRMLEYTENPSLTQEAMAKNPLFSRVTEHWDDSSLGMLADMVPYHSNLWMLDDLIWNNDESVADSILHLPRARWGFWFHSFPYMITEGTRQQKAGNPDYAFDPSGDPEMVSWKPLGIMNVATSILPVAFNEDADLAHRILENTHALKFTSHDLGLVDLALKKFGVENTLGYIYRAATNTTLYPIKQANLLGAAKPTTIATTKQ